MSETLLTASGVVLLLFVAYDVYATILDASGRAGPLSALLNRSVWAAVRGLAFRLTRPRRHRLLNTVGPLLLPALLVVYLLLLVSGFALIYLPRMPAQFSIISTTVGSRLAESFYFSGVTLVTIGYGDITPRTMLVRFVALVEGGSGFALISLAVTYLITVYNALGRVRVIALSFYHQAEEGADVAGFIAHHFVGGRFYGFESVLRMAARDIHELQESHAEHPVIHYFHPVAVHKSLPRIFFIVLETCAVINSCLDEDEYAETCRHPEVRTLEASGLHVLGQLVGALNLKHGGGMPNETAAETTSRRRRRHRQTLKQLRDAGIKVRPDQAAGWEIYRARRARWEPKLHAFATYLGYDWDEVTGDRDLRYAADEEMEETELKP
ncbi:MAG TPA: potassium channel family protein [Pyrinomonadaceae bacterium]|nr:potassium channel family protein [Pyrinomonadaceae bacterium]